ncbi:cytochrome P450 [Henriciella sp.]|uniref:cytochrome P450 n=1 Tax=Henriciella sp. TaxID=1968823 RepID=UPI002614C537|nr:cytochrome P450 [Henriciella sp.]
MADDQKMSSVPQSIFQTSAYDPAGREDPHTPLKALRQRCPVMRDEQAQTWFLTRYSDIRETVNDRSFVRYPAKAEPGSLAHRFVDDDGRIDEPSILFLDDPDHSRIRLPLARAFYARIQKMKPQIEAIIDGIIADAPARGSFDLMAEIAVPIPVLVIARILGVDENRLSDFRDWSEGAILSLNPLRTEEETAHMRASSDALNGYFRELMEARRQVPQDDLISDMVTLQASGEADLDDEELRRNLQALLIGGNLTTTDLIGNGVWLFLTHPGQLAALKADPDLAGQAVEEVLRYEAPVSATSRIVPEDREVGGCPMKARQTVFCSLAGANRDEAVFDEADTFDITVKRPSHVAFGGGPHICIGAPLARIEARRVYLRLFERYPDMALSDVPLVWRTLPFFRGLETLHVDV